MPARKDIALLHSIVLVCILKDMSGHLTFVIASSYSYDSILLMPDITLCRVTP